MASNHNQIITNSSTTPVPLLSASVWSDSLRYVPELTFGEVEAYARRTSTCNISVKAYKFFAEPGYLHGVKISQAANEINIKANCYRSMKKNEKPHSLRLMISTSKEFDGQCSCVAGLSGYCNHLLGLMYFLAHCKQLNLDRIPDVESCTSQKQRWSIPRESRIKPQQLQEVYVKKVQVDADYTRFIKSTLYSPSTSYVNFSKTHFSMLQPTPLFASILPDGTDLPYLEKVQTKFGYVPKGSALSYQQALSNEYAINDYGAPTYPSLPFPEAEQNFDNNFQFCLSESKQKKFDQILRINSIEIESETRDQSKNILWVKLRKDRITASKFGMVAKRQSNFENVVNLFQCKQTPSMKRGIELESKAASIYASQHMHNSVNLFPSGLIIHPKSPWLGCSPDRKVYDIIHEEFGLLEVKVVKEGTTSMDTVKYLHKNEVQQYILKRNHIYYYQVQCQLALTGSPWCDFFSYANDTTYMCERIYFDKLFFQTAKDKVDEYYFTYFL